MSDYRDDYDAVRAPRRPRWLLRSLLLAPLLLLTCAGLLWWTQGRTVANMIAAIRERGEPVTPAEVEAFYVRPPADKDTTRLWTTATAKLSAAGQSTDISKLPFIGSQGTDPPPPGQPWQELAASDQFLKNQAASMQMLHEASAQGGAARYPTDFSQGFMMLLLEVQNLRTGARCLAMEAYVRAHQGNAAGTAESLRAIHALSRSLENEPLIVSQLVRIAICGMADAYIKELLPAVQFSDADLARLEEETQATDFQPALHRAMLGERVMGIVTFDNPAGLGLTGPASWASRIVRGRDLPAYLSIMEDYAAATSKPWPATLTETKQVSQQLPGRMGRFNILTQQLVPALDAATNAAARGTAQCRVTALAIALERYRRANGKPAAQLDDLAPKFINKVPLDPFTGDPFHYQLSDAGYVVYSLGGIKTPQNTDAETGALESLLFRWPAKPKPAPAPDDADEPTPDVDDAAPNANVAAPDSKS